MLAEPERIRGLVAAVRPAAPAHRVSVSSARPSFMAGFTGTASGCFESPPPLSPVFPFPGLGGGLGAPPPPNAAGLGGGGGGGGAASTGTSQDVT